MHIFCPRTIAVAHLLLALCQRQVARFQCQCPYAVAHLHCGSAMCLCHVPLPSASAIVNLSCVLCHAHSPYAFAMYLCHVPLPLLMCPPAVCFCNLPSPCAVVSAPNAIAYSPWPICPCTFAMYRRHCTCTTAHLQFILASAHSPMSLCRCPCTSAHSPVPIQIVPHSPCAFAMCLCPCLFHAPLPCAMYPCHISHLPVRISQRPFASCLCIVPLHCVAASAHLPHAFAMSLCHVPLPVSLPCVSAACIKWAWASRHGRVGMGYVGMGKWAWASGQVGKWAWANGHGAH